MELGRYFNSKDEPIVLSQSHNHARIVLHRQRRHNATSGEALSEDDSKFLQLENELDPNKELPECN